MALLMHYLLYAAGIANIICFILVLVAMYKHRKTTIMLVCIVLFFLGFGLGGLIAFVYGWMNAVFWRIYKLMVIWSAALAALLLLGGRQYLLH